MDPDKVMRNELLALLKGGQAHMDFDEALAGFPLEEINRQVPNASYMVWHVLEHMRIVQWDILEFIRNPDHVSPDFPGGYWPEPGAKATSAMWNKILKKIRSELEAVEAIVSNSRTDFFSPIPHAKDYNIFREVLLVADHNAFHLSEVVEIRRILNLKPVKEY
ncbi:MAG: DinB family protein [Syntrophorhabdaceae bacterium]